MSYRKYLKDYRIEEQIGDNGRLRRVAKYVGPTYRFLAAPEVRRRDAWLFLAATVGEWIAFFLPLFFKIDTGRQYYALIPYALRLLPLFFVSTSAYGFLTAREPVKREQNDGLYGRASVALIVQMAFGAVAAVGVIVALILHRGGAWTDILLAVCLLVGLILDGALFYLRRTMKTQATGDGAEQQHKEA
jgi:hypothetical protein